MGTHAQRKGPFCTQLFAKRKVAASALWAERRKAMDTRSVAAFCEAKGCRERPLGRAKEGHGYPFCSSLLRSERLPRAPFGPSEGRPGWPSCTMVAPERIELSHPYGYTILSRARLPIPPQSRRFC